MPSPASERVLRIRATRRAAVVERLGGRCALCGDTEDLELDHVDPTKKTAEFAHLLTRREAVLDAELENAQLLCKTCHREKTAGERSRARYKPRRARAHKPGHLRERAPGVWEVIVNGPPDPITGRRQQISRTVRGGWDAADEKRDELVAQVKVGRFGDAEITLAALLEVWLDAVRDDLSPTTSHEYARLARNLIAKAPVGRLELRKLTGAVLTDFYRALRRSGRATNTVRNVHAVIRGALDYAVLAEWMDDNPAAKARRPRGESKKHRVPSRDEARALVDGALAGDHPNAELAAFLRLALATGARRGEVVALRRSDLDLDASIVWFRRAVVHDGDRLVEKDTKAHAERCRRIGPNAADALREHLEAMDARAAGAGVRISKRAFVFSKRMDCSTPWDPDTVTSYFVVLRNRLGLKHIRLHDLRHFRGSEESAAGIPLPTVAEGLGHRDSTTTARFYLHDTGTHSEAAAAVADDLFD